MLEAFQSDPFDMPLALLYLVDADEKYAHLCNRLEVTPESPLSPAMLDLTAAADPRGWPLALAIRTAQPQIVTDLVARFVPSSWQPLGRTAPRSDGIAALCSRTKQGPWGDGRCRQPPSSAR